ncbi:MAG TPA: VOC family protein [Pirellulales bacterium]|jgi:predicted enzyme related to lactoylglutathione lyase|nr:VOC family protein [Pirellulales bacterium]
MIQGLRTVIYHVSDLATAKTWYNQVLNQEPYFDQPFYVGYSVGGFELGLVPDGKPGPGGTVAYWGVADAAAAVARLQSLGAAISEPLQDVGEGIRVAAVADPFGNSFGIIENPHFALEKVR